MIGFIGTSVTISLNYKPYRAIADLHSFQFTVEHALGFFVFTCRLLATDIIETSTSNHYEVLLSFLLQSPWNADLILSIQSLYCAVLICIELMSATHRVPSMTDFTALLASKFASLITILRGPNAQKTRFRYCCLRRPHRKHIFLYCCVTAPPMRKCVYGAVAWK
jgi:hypothetical protein